MGSQSVYPQDHGRLPSTVNLTELEYAAQTAKVTKFYAYHAPERKAAAREALRRFAKSDALLHKEDGMADVALENLWNILIGN